MPHKTGLMGPLSHLNSRKLRGRMLVLLLGSIAVVMLISQIIFYVAQNTSQNREYQLRATHIAERLAYTMDLPMWSYDRDHLEQLIAQELKNSDVLAVTLMTADNALYIGKTRNKENNSLINIATLREAERFFIGPLSAASVISHKGQRIGLVKVSLNQGAVSRQIRDVMMMNLAQMLLVLGFIASLTYIGLSRIVLRPLQTLHSFALELADGNLSARTAIPGNDEIGNLGVTLNMMAEKLDHAIDLVKEKEEQLRLYLQRLPIACILWGTDCRVQSWNPAAERIFGYLEAEALGKTANQLIVPESVRTQVDVVWDKISNGALDASSINENLTRDGRTILCEWTNTPYFDKNGNISGVISVAQDITDRRKAEESLIQNEKMTMIAGMAAGIAHEVNNPLGIVAQDLQNLERRFSPTLPANCKVAGEIGLDLGLVEQYMQRRDMLSFMASMRSAVKRASTIMANMLQFSRQSDASHQQFCFNDVIEQSINLAASDFDLRKKYDFKHIAITREYGEELPRIFMCITEIEQVFINLLKNAAQALCDASIVNPAIVIRTFRSNGHVVATVRDNGPGMSTTHRQRIFDPFFTTKDIGAGTGLGLSVSYTIITKNHGGELTAESTPGNGACFTIRLPAHDKE